MSYYIIHISYHEMKSSILTSSLDRLIPTFLFYFIPSFLHSFIPFSGGGASSGLPPTSTPTNLSGSGSTGNLANLVSKSSGATLSGAPADTSQPSPGTGAVAPLGSNSSSKDTQLLTQVHGYLNESYPPLPPLPPLPETDSKANPSYSNANHNLILT